MFEEENNDNIETIIGNLKAEGLFPYGGPLSRE
jgi:hypothetical protein